MDDELLDASFGARLTRGYHCAGPYPSDWYSAHDEHDTIRLQTDIAYPDPTDVDAVSSVTLGNAEVFQVYLGGCLYAPGCTDVMIVPPCGDQDIRHVYEAIAGEATLRWVEDSLAGTVNNLLLEGRNGEPAVEVAELALPALPPWED